MKISLVSISIVVCATVYLAERGSPEIHGFYLIVAHSLGIAVLGTCCFISY